MGDLPLVVLCGGRGTRLRPATDDIPKALVPVNGQPIIDYIVKFLPSGGAGLVYLSWLPGRAGPGPPRLPARRDQRALFGQRRRGGDPREDSALRAELPDRFVAYCDTFIDIDLDRLNEYHIAQDAGATLVTAPIQSPFGVVRATKAVWHPRLLRSLFRTISSVIL